MARRLLFHVQHLLGIGHLKRAGVLARACEAAGFEVTVLLGGGVVPGADFGAARCIQLAPVRAADASFNHLVDAEGRAIDDAFRAARRDRVLAAFDDTRPDIVLLEAFPFGRRAFRFELLPLIERARQATWRPAVATSVRDILVAKPDPARIEETVATVRRDIAAVLVHGDPGFVPFETTFPAMPRIADRIRYTGYVHDRENDGGPAAETFDVVVSAGGGAVGFRLLRAAIEARPLTRLRNRRWLLVAGPNLPEAEWAALAASVRPPLALARYRSDLPRLLRQCMVSVSQAGYNTVLDVLAARCGAVLVPFAAPGETEQSLRARRLAELGLAGVVDETALTPERLAAAIDDAALRPVPAAGGIDVDGARKSAAILAALGEGGPSG